MTDPMFCFQCQETAKNTGCTVRGVCGKPAEVARLQDLLIYLLKGIAFWGTRGRDMGVTHPETNLFVAEALFSTITNANFDSDRFVELIQEAVERRENLRKKLNPGALNCMAIPARELAPIGLPGNPSPITPKSCSRKPKKWA